MDNSLSTARYQNEPKKEQMIHLRRHTHNLNLSQLKMDYWSWQLLSSSETFITRQVVPIHSDSQESVQNCILLVNNKELHLHWLSPDLLHMPAADNILFCCSLQEQLSSHTFFSYWDKWQLCDVFTTTAPSRCCRKPMADSWRQIEEFVDVGRTNQLKSGF